MSAETKKSPAATAAENAAASFARARALQEEVATAHRLKRAARKDSSIRALLAEHGALQKENDLAAEKLRDLADTLTAATAENESLKSRISTLESDLAALRDRHAAAVEQGETLAKELAAIRDQHAASKKK